MGKLVCQVVPQHLVVSKGRGVCVVEGVLPLCNVQRQDDTLEFSCISCGQFDHLDIVAGHNNAVVVRGGIPSAVAGRLHPKIE